MACAQRTVVREIPPNLLALTEPTRVEGPYKTLEELVDDPKTVTKDVFHFAGSAQDAVASANDDKAAIRRLLTESQDVEQPKKCRWWQRDC